MRTEKDIKDRIRSLNANGNLEWIKFQSGFKDALLWVLELDTPDSKPFDMQRIFRSKEADRGLAEK